MGTSYPSVPGLDVQVDGAVLGITLDNPQRRNALNDASMAAFIRVLEQAATDEELRAVMLRGSGDTFCSGFDIVGRNAKASEEAKPRTGSIQRRLPTQANRLIPLLLELQLPVVCAVRGSAVGIGAQLAVAADFTVAALDARFWYPFTRRGFTPDSGSTWLLPRLVGPLRARQLLMLARDFTGEEAEAWGIVHAAVPDHEVLPSAETLAAELAAGPTVALGLTKALLHGSFDHDLRRHLADEAYAMELSSRSPDFREGLKAFAERRDPDFQGR